MLRADFYGRLAELDRFTTRIGSGTLLVAPLSEVDIRRVVDEPPTRRGVSVDADLADVVSRDVRGRDGALPLVSVALQRAWATRVGDRLTVADYHAGGGVSGAVESMAEEAYASLDPDGQAAARRTLLRLAAFNHGVWTRRPAPLADVAPGSDPAAQRAITALVSARVITVDAVSAELTHDALLSAWPRLRDWLDERAVVADQLDVVASAARRWEAEGRPTADLMRGARLQAALEWSTRHPQDLTGSERTYVEASRLEVDLVVRRESRRRRVLTAVSLVLAAALALVTAVGVVAVRAGAAADAATLRADAGRLAALSYTATDVPTALRLAAASYALDDSSDTRAALLSADQRISGALFRIPMDHRVIWADATSDGSRLLAMDNARVLVVVDAASHRIMRRVPLSGDRPAAMTPDGMQLLMCGSQSQVPSTLGTAALVDANTGKTVRVVTRSAPEVSGTCGTLSPDGRQVVLLQSLQRANESAPPQRLVEYAASASSPPREMRLPAAVVAASFSGRTAALLLADGTFDVVDLGRWRLQAHGRHPELADRCGNDACPLAVSPDGSHLGFVDPSHPDVARLLTTARLSGPATDADALDAPVDQLSFAPDGSLLGVGGRDGSVLVVQPGDAHTRVQEPSDGGAIQTMAWMPGTGDPRLLTAGGDSELSAWDLNPLPRDVALPGQVPADDGDGSLGGPTWVVTRDGGRTMVARDIRTGSELSWPVTMSPDETGEWFLPSGDGRRVVYASALADGSSHVRVWDTTTGSLLLDRTGSPWVDWHDHSLVAGLDQTGRQVVVMTGYTSCLVIDVGTGQVLHRLTLRIGGPYASSAYLLPIAGRPPRWGADGGPAPGCATDRDAAGSRSGAGQVRLHHGQRPGAGT